MSNKTALENKTLQCLAGLRNSKRNMAIEDKSERENICAKGLCKK